MSAHRVTQRFAFAALEAASGQGVSDIAACLGRARMTVQQAKRRGLSPRQADEYAVGLGLHPLNVWPSFYDDVAA